MCLPCPVVLCKRGNKSGKRTIRALALLKYMEIYGRERQNPLCKPFSYMVSQGIYFPLCAQQADCLSVKIQLPQACVIRFRLHDAMQHSQKSIDAASQHLGDM